MPRHWLTIAVLIALIAGIIKLLDSSPEALQPDAASSSEQDAQLTGYLTGVITTEYDESGAMKHRFTTERMSHFQPDPDTASPGDYTTINMPFFTFFQADDPPWYARAQEGRSTQNGEVVILQNDVRVWRENEALEPTVITTSELIIRPEAQVAETDQFVMMTAPRVVTQGVGMRANLKQETFAIFSQGSATYEPNP